jgi:hypothetical protein
MKRPVQTSNRAFTPIVFKRWAGTRACQFAVAFAALVACTCLGRNAVAQNDKVRPEKPVRYMGMHLGGGILIGPSLLADSDYTESLGYVLGAFARASSVLQLFDGQLEYQYGRHLFQRSGQPVELNVHALSFIANIHPAFLAILGNSRLAYSVSSIYLQSGVSVEFTNVNSAALKIDRDNSGLALFVGGGFDVPLDDPNDGGGFWMGFNYRYKVAFTNAGIGKNNDLNAHLFLFCISYRMNDLNFTRLPRPPELKFH